MVSSPPVLASLRERLEGSIASWLARPGSSDRDGFTTWARGTEAIHGAGSATARLMASQAALLLVSACTHARATRAGAATGMTGRVAAFLDLASGISPVARACRDVTFEALHAGNGKSTSRDALGALVPWITDGIVQPLLAWAPGEPRDRMSAVHQALFSRGDKHAAGEHYTPAALATRMVERLGIEPGQAVLDPACGAGAFLVPAIARLTQASTEPAQEWYHDVRGWDVNPFSVISCIVNAWLAIGDASFPIEDLFTTITVQDALLARGPRHDAIIGNPPWVTLKDFATASGQGLARDVARAYSIAPDPHDIPQLELATVIHARCFDAMLASDGWSFLVMPASIIDGKHCGKVRRFPGAISVELWRFTGVPLFPRSCACLLEQKGDGTRSYFEDQPGVAVRTWSVVHEPTGDQAPGISIEEGERATLVPDRIDARTGTVGRLVHPRETMHRIPVDTPSPYKKACYNGATIFPQNLLFVRVTRHEGGGDRAVIVPELAIRAKAPWTFLPFDEARVDAASLFELVKGSELHPFGVLEPWTVFLPITDDGDRFARQADPGSLSAAHFSMLEAIYDRHRSTRGRVPDLWTRVNFDNELVNPAMAKPWKVVFPDCGSIMAAAIVPRRVIVEHALHYIGVDDEQEARYLLGVLNAPCVAIDIVKRKSERHIGQLVLDYPIPAFDPSDPAHLAIASHARRMEARVKVLASAHVASILAASEGLLQCTGCHGFVKPGAWDNHERGCKKGALMARLPPGVPRHVVVDPMNPRGVHVRPARRAMKQVLDRDAGHARASRDLDEQVRDLLGVPGRGGEG